MTAEYRYSPCVLVNRQKDEKRDGGGWEFQIMETEDGTMMDGHDGVVLEGGRVASQEIEALVLVLGLVRSTLVAASRAPNGR